jgi:putative oxidoreductase
MNNVTHAILRVGAGLLFLEHGAQKMLGWMGGFGPNGGTAPLMTRFGAAGILELVGGLLLIVGLFTRPVGVVLTLEMLVAFYLGHLPRGGWPVQNQGELALLYACIFAFFASHGGGAFSLDGRLGKRRW